MKNKQLFTLFLFLALMIASSCKGERKSTVIPPSGFLHYYPQDNHPIQLEFNYPESWIMEDSGNTYDDSRFISFHDPQDPNPTSYSINHVLSTYGHITISNEYPKYRKDVNEVIDYLLKARSINPDFELISDSTTQINDQSFQILEYRILPTITGYSEPMFEKVMFLLLDKNYYEIRIMISESQRHNEFEAGFDELTNSLQVIP